MGCPRFGKDLHFVFVLVCFDQRQVSSVWPEPAWLPKHPHRGLACQIPRLLVSAVWQRFTFCFCPFLLRPEECFQCLARACLASQAFPQRIWLSKPAAISVRG